MTALPRLHFIVASEDRDSALEQMWRVMLPSLNRQHWSVVDGLALDGATASGTPASGATDRISTDHISTDKRLSPSFDGHCDGIAVLPAADGSIPENDRITALHERFPELPVYQLWRHWPAYERLYTDESPSAAPPLAASRLAA